MILLILYVSWGKKVFRVMSHSQGNGEGLNTGILVGLGVVGSETQGVFGVRHPVDMDIITTSPETSP